MKISNYLGALAVLAVLASSLRGDDPESTVPDKEMMDAAIKEIAAANDVIFNQYVDLSELDDAWTYLDAEALADIGIKLAEAERILFRTHDAVKSEDVLKIAVRTASIEGIAPALEKLKAYAEKTENGEMLQQIKLASQLGGKSRSVAPTLSLDDVSIGAFIAYKQAQLDLKTALVTSDIKMLEDLQSRVGKYAEKEPAVWKKLSSQVMEQYKNMKALGAPSRGGPDDMSGASETLNKLSGVSRGNPSSAFSPQKTAVAAGVANALSRTIIRTNPRYGGWGYPYVPQNPWTYPVYPPYPPSITYPPSNPYPPTQSLDESLGWSNWARLGELIANCKI